MTQPSALSYKIANAAAQFTSTAFIGGIWRPSVRNDEFALHIQGILNEHFPNSISSAPITTPPVDGGGDGT